ncbi:GTP-binding protein Rho1 [Orbilia ellipsospora]|uniref:GTP-binding protein Rho1 n=1 Tax=Orbilia ellipsospora TaxID=2528407 RepID=A0AAV9WSP3_9PEZI
MDPLLIAAGVVSLLGTTLRTGVVLRRFLYGAQGESTLVNAIISDVKALRKVLELMDMTFEEMDCERTETGAIGAHWGNLLTVLQDGHTCLVSLRKLLEETTKEVEVLDGPLRRARLKPAMDKIALYRQEVQTYEDVLNLSLETTTFYNQTLVKEENTQLILKTRSIHRNIQRLATNLDVKLVALEAAVRQQLLPNSLDPIKNLKATVTSAATVILSKSTVLSSAFSYGIYSGARDQSVSDYGTSTTPPILEPATNTFTATVSSSSSISGYATASQLQIPRKPIKGRVDVILPAQSQPESMQIASADTAQQPTSANERTKTRKRTQANLSINNFFGRQNNSGKKVRIKIVVVGDGGCGKTCFLIRATKGSIPEAYIPTIFENYFTDVCHDNFHYELAFWDTAGQEDYDRVRPLAYPDTQVILVCFTIDSPDSFDNVKYKWTPEVRHFLSAAPIILVGMKSDLRDDPRTIGELLRSHHKPVTTKQGINMMDEISATTYIECSAKTGEGCNEVINAAITAAVNQERRGETGEKKKSKGLFSWLFRS